jgi:hypothetical protein
MTVEPPHVLDRLVPSLHPTMRDFMSYGALGIPPRRPLSSRQHDQWQGVSLYRSTHAAHRRAELAPEIGRYLAEVRIPADASVRIEQTGRDSDHYTVWADADDLLRWVVSVSPLHRL